MAKLAPKPSFGLFGKSQAMLKVVSFLDDFRVELRPIYACFFCCFFIKNGTCESTIASKDMVTNK